MASGLRAVVPPATRAPVSGGQPKGSGPQGGSPRERPHAAVPRSGSGQDLVHPRVALMDASRSSYGRWDGRCVSRDSPRQPTCDVGSVGLRQQAADTGVRGENGVRGITRATAAVSWRQRERGARRARAGFGGCRCGREVTLIEWRHWPADTSRPDRSGRGRRQPGIPARLGRRAHLHRNSIAFTRQE
jgi:hypothetical protein